MGLALSGRGFKLPTGKLYLLGAGHIHFEVFFHWVTSWIEVEGLVGIATVDETTKNPFCQEKNGLPGISLRWTVSDLRNETTWSGFLWYLTVISGETYIEPSVSYHPHLVKNSKRIPSAFFNRESDF